MKFGVTGASSDIGINLLNLLRDRGHDVTKFGRKEGRYWEIGREFPKSDIDVLFHLAHDRSITFAQNREAVNLLISSFGRKIVYISSTSGHPQSLSNYGKSKYAAQCAIDMSGGTSIVSGMMFGTDQMSQNSIISKLRRISSSYPIIPLPFAGMSKLYFSDLHMLSEALLYAAESGESGSFRGFSENYLTLGELMRKLSRYSTNNPRIFEIPDLGLSKILSTTSRSLSFPGLFDSLLSLVSEMPYEYIEGLRKFPEIRFQTYS